MSKTTIGVLTGGGDCPGLNAVIRAVTKTATLRGARVIGFRDGFAGIVEDLSQDLDFRSGSGILTRGGTILGSSNRVDPFNCLIDGVKQDVSARAIATLERHGVDVLIAIGGDGSLSISERLYREHGLPVIGVPKTIDNDLSGTERTFGFDSAVTIATDAIDRIHTTAQSHGRVMIVELMGRYAGWITLHAGVAGGADVILIPEIEYDIDIVAEVCREREELGIMFTIIAIAEGAKARGGELTVKRVVDEATDPVRLGGVGYVLASALEERLGDTEVRVTVLGHLQRGGVPTAFDRVLATRFGNAACELALAGQVGVMVGLRNDSIVPVPLSEAVDTLKRVQADDEIVSAARSVRTSFGDVPLPPL